MLRRDGVFTHVIFQVQYEGAYYLGVDDTSNAVEFCIITLV